MSRTSDLDTPQPLPRSETAEGRPRRVGVEIEFSGLTEAQVARILVKQVGGAARETQRGHWTVSGGGMGDFEVYLDSQPLERLDHDGVGGQIRDLARAVVPVEIVSDPLEVAQIAELDRAIVALREAGAEGTGSGVLSAFGVHFNPEVVSLDYADIMPVLTAHALLEDYLKRAAGTDFSRRVMTWVAPYPRALVDRLAAEAPPATMTELIDTYLQLSPSRNHGLDMLCIFAQIDEARVAAAVDMELVSARPTFHWRLPDCRIDEDGWTLAQEWNRWVLVERVAEDTDLLRRLCAAWRDHRDSITSIRMDWSFRVERMLQGAGLCDL
ncbi:amidoligase family protein [Alloyangia pacifica]|uniref:Putative amidoligase enzyme n=1 Tax=Alloyangia pacifica TaxID=311180 RepID=A0A1I6WME0_9RHOB|nr:amidoligase family protein [Alloyangia pacifica]SDI90243.1 Putative amidoligase enzyme [Alloyangia pacifica]SFT26841.1 Putative amidoligase enzyme [Alloyangia pacifica]